MTQLLESQAPPLPVAASTLSVVLPTLNEADHLPRVLERMRGADVQVIVADGGSTDATISIAERFDATIVCSEPGRARQMNAGAAVANGDVLLFLHADTVLPEDFSHRVAAVLDQSGVAAGGFRFTLDDRRMIFRIIERLVQWRCSLFQLPYGDQALFMRREVFEGVGGFPDQPIMEDVALVRALRRRGRVYVCNEPAVTSARRWRRAGFVRVMLFNQLAMIASMLGVSPHRIAAWRP